jgi:hypothetical protein
VTRDVCHAGFYRVRRRAGIRSVPLSTQSVLINATPASAIRD